MVWAAARHDDGGMTTTSRLHHSADGLVEAARAFQAAADQPGSQAGASDSLAAMEEALRLVSAGWYQLAAAGSPAMVRRGAGRGSEAASRPPVEGRSREQEVRLTETLHDVAAAFARCARSCRQGRSLVNPILARRVAGDVSTMATSSTAFQGTNDRESTSRDRLPYRSPPLPPPIAGARRKACEQAVPG